MESAFDTAFRALPMLSRDELTRLQARISDLLREPETDDIAALFRPLDEAELEAELDAAIAEFNTGKGYDAHVLCQSVRERFGWKA